MAKKILSLEERFMSKVRKEPGEGCWIWVARIHPLGYGSFGMPPKTGATWEVHWAHRVSYELFVGAIPKGVYVLHSCDVRACVRPSHLFLGTQGDNIRDMAKKGRGRKSKAGLPYGVSRCIHQGPKPFRVQINLGGKVVHLGVFATEEEAAAVAIQYREEFFSSGV